jgi:hypothetical protein
MGGTSAAAAVAPTAVHFYINRGTLFGDTVRLAFDALPPLPAPPPTPAGPSPVPADAPNPAAPAERKPTPEYKWLHVANEGTYKGHHQGEFTLTAETFATMVRNFRAHPKFERGRLTLDGKETECGTGKVVQFDYEHASEMAPWEGSIPTSGAPAMGWALDLEPRKGASGGAQLWALAKLGAQIRGQIDREEYESTSIAWNPDGVDPISGAPIGAVLTSIAFTNHPFIRDLTPLAAANRAAGHTAKVSVEPSAQPTEAHAGGDGSTPRGASSPMTALSADLRTSLCRLYHLTPEASDGAVIRAAENAASAGTDLAGLLKALGVADPTAALAAVPDLLAVRNKLAEKLAELDALMRADTVADSEVQVEDVAAAFSARRFTDPSLLASLQAHRSLVLDAEIAKLPEPKRKDPGEVRAARARGRVAFLTHYGVNLNPAQQHLTQTFVAGPGQGGISQQFLPPAAAPMPMRLPLSAWQQPMQMQHPQQPQQFMSQPMPMQLTQQTQQPPFELASFDGRNQTEQIISYLTSIDAGFGKLEHGQKVQRASQWRRQNPHLCGAAA